VKAPRSRNPSVFFISTLANSALDPWFENRENGTPFLIRAGVRIRRGNTHLKYPRELVLKQQELVAGSPAEPAASTTNSVKPDERRQSVRFPISASAEMQELRTRTRLTGRASDLGVGGCYIDTISPFPVGSPLLISLTSESHSFLAKANVTYALTGMGMGLMFTEIGADQKKQLSAWLRELNGEVPEPPTEHEFAEAISSLAPEPVASAAPGGMLEALYELVSLLASKRVLTEAEVKLLRQKLGQ
jgi:PilZ domain